LDFTNKAFEALDYGAHDLAEPVLASLARSYATGERMEESNEWRNPIDLIAICERAFESIPAALESGRRMGSRSWSGREELASVILGEDPQAIADTLLSVLGDGASLSELAGTVVYAGALRIARFHISNEFGDWDTAHHSFIFANALHQAIQRAPSAELLRGAFDASARLRHLREWPCRIRLAIRPIATLLPVRTWIGEENPASPRDLHTWQFR
jgi:hypothetical protein